MKVDLRNLDRSRLKALDALLDQRNVTRAARRLCLTQPAVSGTLTRLRDYFDDPLFVRAPHGMVPTSRAQALAVPIKQVLADIDALLTPVQFDPETADFTFTLAATDYALKAVLVPFIAALKPQAPGIRVRIVQLEEDAITARMAEGSIDVALLTPHTTPPELHSRVLYEEDYVCMLRATHPALEAKTLTLDAFCALEHMLVSWQGKSFQGVTDEALAALGRTRRVGLSVSSFLILPEILAISDMIAVLPRRLASQRPDMRVLTPPLPIPGFSKSMAWHERTHRDPAHRWLRQLLVDTSRSAT